MNLKLERLKDGRCRACGLSTRLFVHQECGRRFRPDDEQKRMRAYEYRARTSYRSPNWKPPPSWY